MSGWTAAVVALLATLRSTCSSLRYVVFESSNPVSRLLFRPSVSHKLGLATALLCSLFLLETKLFTSYDAADVMMNARAGLPFDPVRPSCIAFMMQNPVNLYVYLSPIQRLVVSTNLVPLFKEWEIVAGLVIVLTGLGAMAFLSSDNELDRKIGVVFFHAALWLLTFVRCFVSVRQSTDYNFDLLPSLDMVFWGVLILSIFPPLLRGEGDDTAKTVDSRTAPFYRGAFSCSGCVLRVGRSSDPALMSVLLRAIALVVMFAVSSSCWGAARWDLASVCQTPVPDFHQQTWVIAQCERPQLLLLLLLWRWCGPQALVQMLLFAVFFNRLKVFVTYLPPLSVCASLTLYFLCHSYSSQVVSAIKQV